MTPTISVREEFDEEGDLVWTLVAITHDRIALDKVATAFDCDLQFIVSDTPRYEGSHA